MSDDEAYCAFKAVRFADNEGGPFCPDEDCGHRDAYEFATRRIYKCKACCKQFSVTSGTIFASRKLGLRDYLLAIAIFVNGANGHSALRLSRDLCVSYKTAWVLAHKLREVMGSLRTTEKLKGVVEIDAAWVGGHLRPKNPIEQKLQKQEQPNTKFPRFNSAKRNTIVTLRERRRGGRTLSFVAKTEGEVVATILGVTEKAAVLHTDMGTDWSNLWRHREVVQVNHSKHFAQPGGIHVNWVECFHSRIRRAERGVYHHISGRYLQGYADEIGWREDFRRTSNGAQFTGVMRGAATAPTSRDWKGYWQRKRSDAPRPVPTRLLRA